MASADVDQRNDTRSEIIIVDGLLERGAGIRFSLIKSGLAAHWIVSWT